MTSTIEQAFQALYLCRILRLNFHEALILVVLSDRALSAVA